MVIVDVLIKCVGVNECDMCLTEILHKETQNYIYTVYK